MIEFETALAKVLGHRPLALLTEAVDLQHAYGRYLAQAVEATIAVPGFDNSAMDGYAVSTGDVAIGTDLPVSARIAAGQSPLPLKPGTAARIFTGAMVPPNADAVVLQEDTIAAADDCSVRFCVEPTAGQHIRREGEDIQKGRVLAERGMRLNEALIGLLASVGVTNVDCWQPISVAFFSTGDEVREPGENLEPGQIYNSNRYMLQACIEALGMRPIDLGICRDEPQSVRDMLMRAAEMADCIVTTGGMSVGEEDHVREQAQLLGELEFWKLAIKPGKPFAMGAIGETPFFGLPGNPVSAYVTFYLLVRRWLLAQTGAAHAFNYRTAVADFAFNNRGKRKNFLRGTASTNAKGELKASLFANQSSGVLSSLVNANVFIVLEAGAQIKTGDLVQLLLL